MSDPDVESAKVIEALVADEGGKRRTRGGTKRPATDEGEGGKQSADAAAAAAAAAAVKRAKLRQPFADAAKLTDEMASLIEHGLLSPGTHNGMQSLSLSPLSLPLPLSLALPLSIALTFSCKTPHAR